MKPGLQDFIRVINGELTANGAPGMCIAVKLIRRHKTGRYKNVKNLSAEANAGQYVNT